MKDYRALARSQNALSSLFERREVKLLYGFFENIENANTYNSYLTDFRHFIDFIRSELPNETVVSLDHDHLVAYKRSMARLSARTINRKISSISSLYNYLKERGVVLVNPAQKVKRLRVDDTTVETDYLTKEEVQKIFAHLTSEDLKGKMQKSLMVMYLTSGLRKSEVINIRMSDISIEEDSIFIRATLKGGDNLTKKLHPLCVSSLLDYLEFYGVERGQKKDEDYLYTSFYYPNAEDAPLNAKTIWRLFRRIGLEVLGRNIHPHMARTTVATLLLDMGWNTYEVQQFSGWRGPKMAQAYDKKRRKRSLDSSALYSLDQ